MNDLLAELGKPLAVSDVSSSTSLKAPESDLLAELGEPLAVTTDSDDPEERFSAKMADPKERARLQKFAEGLGTTIDDPAFQERVKSPMGLRTYSTLNQMATTGDVDEGTVDEQGRPEGLGVKALLMQFGHAGGMFRRRDDALISRLAAGQEMEVGDTRPMNQQIATGMAGAPSPNIRVFKKIEDMTREEQDATIPKQILDVVSQYDTPEAPMDAKSRAQAIYDVAKTGAQSREQMRQLAAEELAIREEITGKSDGILNTLGTLAAKGMPTVGYGTSFLVGGAPLGAVVAGMDKTSELLSADIDPETGKVLKAGEGYDAARVKGYGYGAFEALSEQFTGKVLGLAFKGLDKITGGYMGKAVSKGADALADTMAKTKIGRGIADLMKGVQRVAGLSYLENPAVEAGEEGIQQWSEKVFARRTSDTETPIYVKNVLNEATGQLEAVPVEPGSDEEETARRQIALYGEKSPYAQAGTRQQTVGEKTQQFNDKFFTWDNMGELAEGFALQYALTLGGGALHAVQSKEARGVVNRALLAAGATNADLIRMSDEQKAEAFDKYYGSEANRAEFAEVFKDAGQKLADMAQRMQDVDTWTRTGNSLKPNVGVDLAKELATGTLTVDDEKSGLSADQKVTPDGTEITVRDRDGLLQPVTVGNAAEAQKAMERMSQLKQGREADMNSRAQIAQNVANAFAPGRRLVLVHNSADMLAAAKGEYADEGKTFDEAGFKGDAKGLTTPRGTLIVNVAAATGFDDLVETIKHETGHSVADEAGLTKLMAGKTVDGIAAEFQKAGIIASGAGGLEKFVKAVESVRAQYAARGVKLADADAVAEVLSMQQERMTPVFRKKFGDGLVTLLRGKDKSAKNMRDVRRAVALIMYSGREAKVDLYGGPDAWKAPAPAFTGDPIAAAGTETGEKEAVEPAEEAAPEAMPAQGEEAPGAEAVPPVAAPEAKPPAAPSPEAKAAAKDIKAAFEEKQKAKTPVEEAAPVETPPEAPKAEPPAPATPVAKMTFPSEEAMLEYVAAHQEETENWTEESFEIVPAPAPAKSDGAPIVPTSDKAAVEAYRDGSRKKFEDAKKPAAAKPTAQGVKWTPENQLLSVADRIEVLRPTDVYRLLSETPEAHRYEMRNFINRWHADNQRIQDEVRKAMAALNDAPSSAKPQVETPDKSKPEAPRNDGSLFPEKDIPFNLEGEAQEDVVRVDAEKKAEEERLAEAKRKKDAEPILPGIDEAAPKSSSNPPIFDSRNADLPQVEVESAPQVAKMSAEVTFESVPKKGQYAEIPGVSTAQGKRMYLIQGKWGDGNTFHVSPTHHGIVLTGMGVLLRTKGNPSAHSGVRIVGGGKVPEGSEKWGVAEWATHNQKLSNRHKEGAKPAVPTASDSAPTAEAKPVEAPKTETPKAEPPAPAEPPVAPAKPKRKFADLDALAGYMADHPEETVEWTEEDYEIEAGEAVPAQAAPESVSPAVEAPTAPIFEPRQRRLGEPKFKYDQAIKADRAAWEAEQAGKAKPVDVAPFEIEGLRFNGIQRIEGMPDQVVWTDEETNGTFYMPADATAEQTAAHRDESRKTFKAAASGAKDAEEIAEVRNNAETSARVDAIPDEIYDDNPALAVMNVELPAYAKRKATSTRTADSMERQAYSTPPPLAAIGAAAVAGAGSDTDAGVTVIEPTAGNGGLLAVLQLAENDRVLANELDKGRAARLRELFPDGRFTVTQGDYADTNYQDAVETAGRAGPRAFLMNPPFGPTDESGLKLEHRIALKTIASARPGDTMFFIGAAPGRDAMKMQSGALAGAYTAGAFAKFHSRLNEQGWKPMLHFIADGALYKKMGAAFPVEVLLMEKTSGVTPDLHRPMRDLPARYATWEQIRAAVAEMYNPGALALTERVAASLSATPEREKEAREEANLNASTSAEEPNAAREKEGTDPETGAPRYRLSQDVELGLVTPDTDLTPNPAMLKIFGRVWDKEFAGKAFNPDQLARAILDLPDETAEARIKTADAIARYLQANPANRFVISGDYISMGSVLRDIFRARWNAERVSTVESAGDRGQIPYESLSSVETATPMKIPVDLATGVMTALDNFAERHPEGIDAYVAEKMRWTPEQERDGRLDGSQIDALGMAIEKIDEGTGFIVGSQTGAGKGRIMASVMDYHAKQGRVPIFITAQAKLFTDIWRDIVAVGAKDRIKPLVFNEYKAPKTDTDTNSDEADENAFVMPQFFGSTQRSAALADSKLPTGATAVFLTYSQVQNPSESTRRKVQFIANLLTSGRGALVLDEAHLAAGADSARGAVLRNFASMSKPGVVFSSATFAKRGENMTLYKRAGYSAFFKDDEEMDKALSFGGVPFQQYLAARLTERAFYIRHELDYEGVIFDKMETTDTLGTPQERTALSQREEQIADVYNQVIRTVLRFNNAVKLANSRLQKGAPGAHMDGEAFMSSLHNTASFIYTALKAGTVANAAVQELRNGRAPVITLYNTNQALLTEIGINERADVGRYLMRIAEKATSVQMPDGTSAPILSPEGRAYLTSVLKEEQADMLINAADALMGQANSAADYLREQDLPASPIDRVREIVETAGFKFAELTGRSYMVQNGTISHRLKPNPDTVVNAFNNSLGADGKPDTVLLLNSSAAAGLSIHAHPGFKNHAPRVMFVLQPAWDINEMMQIFGRVNRKNQLTKPVYHLMFTSAAGEQRNAAILMKKLRSLSANTSGVSKAGYGETAEDSLDFMNAFGDKALAELEKEQNPVVATINQLRVSDTIRRATAISQFLSVREQELFISEIQKKVAALQEHARESGTHELEAGDVGRVPLTNEQLGAGNTMRAYEVPVMGRATVLTAGEAIERAKAWQAKNGALLEQASEKIKEADKATQNPWLRRNYEMTRRALSDAVESIGRVLTVQDDAGRRMFIPIELWLPPSGAAQVASDWRVKVSFNNIRGVTTIPLTIYGERLLAKAQGGYDYIYNNTLTRKEMRTLVTGDIAKALIGNIVVVGAEGVGITQIVRATPKDGNFSSFVLMMPRGITVAEAKRIVSSRLVKLTDIRDLHGHTDQYGRLEIDSARIIVHPSYSSATGAVNGGMFGFRLATPKRAQSKDISIAQIMRAAGSESRLSDDPDARGYVNSPFLDIEEANMALAALSKLHPALTAHIVVTDEQNVEGDTGAESTGPRYRLPPVASTVPPARNRADIRYRLADPVRVGALRSQVDLENSSPVPFPILSHLRGGSKLVIPYDFRGGEYDWFTENGGFTAFPLAEQQAFFTRPAITERRTRGNIDTLAQEMNFDNTEEFAMAFLAEVERSRALYADEIARQGIRRGTLNAARRKFARIRNKEDVGAVMGRAVAAVAQSLPEDIQGDMARIGETEGEEGVRHFILSRYFEHVLLEMADTYSLAGRDDTLPEEIQDEGTFARPETVNKEGATAPTFQQTKARLAALAATLGAQPLEGVPTVTDEAAAAYVQDIEKTEGQVFLADLAKRLIAERLAGQRETPLTKYEAAVMLRYQTILDARTLATDRAANDAAAENNTAELKMIDNERDQIHADTVEYLDTMRKYGSAAGQALQALKLRVDHGFNIVKIYTQAIEDNGGIALAPAQYAALRDRVLRLEKAWADYMDAVGAPDEADELEARIAELEKQIGEMTAARDTAQKNVDSLGAKRAELVARHAGVAQSAGELSEKRARLQSEIARLESEISFRTGLSQQVEELQAKVDDLMVKMAALDAEYAGIDMNALAEIEAQLADLEAQYRTKQIEYERAAEALKTAVARRARMRKLLEKLSKSTKGKIERRREVQQEASNLYGVFKAEMEKAQLERLAARWRGATPLGKLWLGIGVTRNVIRALQSMGDESVAGRQLAKLGLGHPVLWARAFAQSQKIMFSLAGPVDEKGRLLTLRERSDRALFEEDQLIREHPLWAVLRKAGLDWIDLTADPTSLDEQQIPVSALLRANLPRWTGVGGVTTMLDVSNNHYAAMSNMLRFAVAAQLYEKMQIANGGLPLSEADVRDIVSTVDIFGGRGSITTEKTRSFINLASAILYSPRLAAANVQFYARALGFLNPAHSWRAKKLIASEYMRTLGMYAALSVVARLISEAFSDDPDEQRFQFNWGHPAFLQFVFGQNRVDVSGGAALWARYAGSISGQSSRVSTESGMVMGERSGFDANAFIRLIRSKLDPWSGMILDVAMGKTYSGQAAGPFAEPHQPGYKLRYANMLTSINPTPLLVQTLTDLVSGSPEEGIQPLRNPLVLFPVVSLEMLGVLGSSLPINSDLAQQVESGNTWAAKRLEKLRRKQRDILGDKKMRPEIKEIKAEQIQRQLDQIRGI